MKEQLNRFMTTEKLLYVLQGNREPDGSCSVCTICCIYRVRWNYDYISDRLFPVFL